jgi:heme exporter protein C
MTEDVGYGEEIAPPGKSASSIGLCIVTCALIAVMLYLIFWYVPVESETELMQRIVFLYVPLVWVSGTAFVLLMLTSVGYLVTHLPIWHFRASAMAEAGILFCTITLITGVVRTKIMQGRWWNADITLALMAVVWGWLAIYLGLRRYMTTSPARKWLAGFGILVVFSVPIVYVQLARILPTRTAEVMIRQYTDSGRYILSTLMVSMLACFFLFWYLVQHRISLDVMEEELELLRESILGQNWQTTNLLVENQNFVIEGYSFGEHRNHE